MALNIQVKKVVTLNIDIDQDGLEKLVRDEIARKDRNIKVNSINFKATRNPTGIAVEVDAEYDENQQPQVLTRGMKTSDDSDVVPDVCTGCGEVTCVCDSDTDAPEPKEEPEPEDVPVEEQLEIPELPEDSEGLDSESFEEQEDRLIDEVLDEEDNIDIPEENTELDDEEIPEPEDKPKRKSLFDKK